MRSSRHASARSISGAITAAERPGSLARIAKRSAAELPDAPRTRIAAALSCSPASARESRRRAGSAAPASRSLAASGAISPDSREPARAASLTAGSSRALPSASSPASSDRRGEQETTSRARARAACPGGESPARPSWTRSRCARPAWSVAVAADAGVPGRGRSPEAPRGASRRRSSGEVALDRVDVHRDRRERPSPDSNA